MVRKLLTALDAQRLLIILLFTSIFVMAAQEVTNTDLWWHLASGRYIWERRGVPLYDPFSHTAFGRRWIDHSWLSQVVIYGVYRAAGFGGLAFLAAALITLAFVLVFLYSPGHLYIRVFATLLGALASAVTWEMRPHIFSFLFTALFLFILHLYKGRRGNYLPLLPVLMLIWANCHSGYIAGLIVLAVFIAGEGIKSLLGSAEERLQREEIRQLAMVALATLAVVALNPNTFRLYLYPLQTARIGPLQDFISEWASPNFHRLQFHPFIWVALLSLLALGMAGRRADLTDLLYLSTFGYMSLLAARNIPLFALVATPTSVRYGSEAWLAWRDRRGSRRNQPCYPSGLLVLNWLLLLLAVAGVLFWVTPTLSVSANLRAQEKVLPFQATAFLAQADLPKELFNSYNWGGFLIWQLYPRYRVFVDGRTDLYGEEVLEEYLKAYWASSQWREPLEKYNINSIVIEKDSTFATVLAESSDWQQVYADELAVVFVRESY